VKEEEVTGQGEKGKRARAHGVAADQAEAARLALEAGVDMDMEGYVYERALPGLVKRGVVPVPQIDRAVRRIPRVKIERGLLDKDKSSQGPKTPSLLTAENRDAARRAARESMVLLRNEGPILPLSASLKRIAIVGPLAGAFKVFVGGSSLADLEAAFEVTSTPAAAVGPDHAPVPEPKPGEEKVVTSVIKNRGPKVESRAEAR
jgi:beta-glucosidase-like glycosyl hydrolase